MRGAIFALLVACMPAGALACQSAPHLLNEFRQESFTALPGCDGQWLPGCSAKGISAAWYELPTERYGHGILGDAIEGGRLTVYTDRTANSCGTKSVTLDDDHVFEDVAPRLADLDGDGDMEVIAVRTHLQKGGQLAIYDEGQGEALRLIATTPYIGQTHRWLAPAGIADLDGDGRIEIAYVDRPHLAKTLRIWRFDDGTLTEVARLSGVTNHRIGERDIAGGVRDCGQGPEVIVADANWRRLIAVRYTGDAVTFEDIGPHRDRGSFAAALDCRSPG